MAKSTGLGKGLDALLLNNIVEETNKNEIKNLTNREIRYIIITGGLSEIAGFSYLIEEEFGNLAKVCNISTMGIRHNKYSSTLGIVKYFDEKNEK